MKRLILSIIFLLFASSAIADGANKVSLIKEVLAVMETRSTLEKMRLENVAQVRKMMADPSAPHAEEPLMKRLINRAMEKYDAYSKERMGWELWEPEYIKMYDELFSEEELSGLLEFYKTAAGKASIRALPLIGTRMQQIHFEQKQAADERIQRIMQESVGEIEAEIEKEKG